MKKPLSASELRDAQKTIRQIDSVLAEMDEEDMEHAITKVIPH